MARRDWRAPSEHRQSIAVILPGSRPRVIFRVDEVTWIDAIVRYGVSPREAGSVKSRLIPKLLDALNAAPERVMFPKGDARLILICQSSQSGEICRSS
jgi:hypothetical protein